MQAWCGDKCWEEPSIMYFLVRISIWNSKIKLSSEVYRRWADLVVKANSRSVWNLITGIHVSLVLKMMKWSKFLKGFNNTENIFYIYYSHLLTQIFTSLVLINERGHVGHSVNSLHQRFLVRMSVLSRLITKTDMLLVCKSIDIDWTTTWCKQNLT